MTNTTRFGVPKLNSTGSDLINNIPSLVNTIADDFDAAIMGYSQGVFTSRPTAGTAGRYYLATDVLDGGPNGTLYFDDGTAWQTAFNANRGFCAIATAETRTSSSYGTLTTPDQVSVHLPANGLLYVTYQATWQSSTNTAAAAIFLNSMQVVVAGPGTNTAQGAVLTETITDDPLHTASHGLTTSTTSGNGSSAPATTGQIVGDRTGNTGGPCVIFAAAGTYTVSIQFLATSGSVTVKNRKLWVRVEAFA